MAFQPQNDRSNAAFPTCGGGDDINLAVALAFGRDGLPVFPCGWDKRPLVPCGFHAASTNEKQIIAWWGRWRKALVGVPTGPASNIWVLDVDGDSGRSSLNQLLSRLGLETIGDLTQVIGRTPSGGVHLFFRWQPGETPRNRACDIGLGLDTRGVSADGQPAGYFIAPGSVLPDGRRYELIDAATLPEMGDCT